MIGRLILEDGAVFEGEAFGSEGERFGLVCCYSGTTGHQEMATEPSYLGRIVVFRSPMIGNYGVDDSLFESDRVCVEGIVARELNRAAGSKEAKNFEDFCIERQLLGLTGADTRGLNLHISEKGEQFGLLTTKQGGVKDYMAMIRVLKGPIGGDPDRYRVSGEGLLASVRPGGNKTVLTIDLGASVSFYSLLKSNGLFWRAFGPQIEAAEIKAISPDAVIVTNGPYEPGSLKKTIETISRLAGKVPVLGVGLGGVALGAALGAAPEKMRAGHHGMGFGVTDLRNGECFITSQNHSFTINEGSLSRSGAKVVFRNATDGSLEGFAHEKKRAAGVLFDLKGLELLKDLIS